MSGKTIIKGRRNFINHSFAGLTGAVLAPSVLKLEGKPLGPQGQAEPNGPHITGPQTQSPRGCRELVAQALPRIFLVGPAITLVLVNG